jgi:hypothetical protein
MAQYKNEGYDPKEIKMLKDECKAEGFSFVYCEDEEDDDEMAEAGELIHVQFVGKHNGKEVICDALFCTLRLYHSSLVYENAIEEVKQTFPAYLPAEERDKKYKLSEAQNDEAELLLTEIMETIEEEEEIKVKEEIEVDENFEYGLGLEVRLNVDEITEDIIENFIKKFNAGNLDLDPTLYSFITEDDDEEDEGE